jgi:predicted transcriptional regulator of viral defense system
LIRESQFKIDWDKTTEMIGSASSATQRRLYYIMDLLGKHNELWWRFENAKFPGYRQLDPSRCAKGKHSAKFGLLLNVEREEIVRETMNY